MSELVRTISNWGHQAKDSISPTIYNLSFTNAEKTRHLQIVDGLAGGLLSLLDSDPPAIKRKLGLDSNQMADIYRFGTVLAEETITREPTKLGSIQKQRLATTVFHGIQETTIDTGNKAIDSIAKYMLSSTVKVAIHINADNNQPISAGIWGKTETKLSNPVYYMFLANKPTNTNEARMPGNYIDLSILGGTEVVVYGGGNRIDFSGTYTFMNQKNTRREIYHYLGEFSWEGNGENQMVHCWGHNTGTDIKTLPAFEDAKVSSTMSQVCNSFTF